MAKRMFGLFGAVSAEIQAVKSSAISATVSEIVSFFILSPLSREAGKRPRGTALLQASHYSPTIPPPVHEDDDSRFETIHRRRL
jgi:hypothetical protein